MNISLDWESAKGTANAIVSKSDAHRALIAAALSDRQTNFNLGAVSVDIEATISCLESLGAKVERREDSLTVTPISKKAKNPVLNCRESGSTLRFMIPTAAAVSENPSFTGQGRLAKRPLSPLALAMKERGCSFSAETLPLTISGEMQSGIYTLPGDVSSQFISGLLFALPVLDGDSEIVLSSALQSAAYVDMTIDTLERFKIEVTKTEKGFFVKGNQKYISPSDYIVEGDWSNIAPFMAAAALGGEIKADNLNAASKQSDKEIVSIIKKFGADITEENSFYIIKQNNARPFELDVSQCPDLFPVIAILACGAKGKSRLYNAARLRLKESDRIESTLALIKALGGEAEVKEDSLEIFGTGKLKGGDCDSFNDHRIVMAAAVASLICDNPVNISGAEAINKSFPDFIKHFELLGGNCNVI